MDPQRWDEIQAAFDSLVELDAARRASRLAALGTTDPGLRALVESLLGADGEVDAKLAPLDAAFLATAGATADPFGLAGRTVSHFRILGPIGAGGMGVVYRAEDTRLGRAVALKFLLPQTSLDPSAKARFLHEARAAAAIDHPNLCTVYEVGESDDGRLFLAMALYGGETLKARLAREGPLPVEQGLAIARQIAAGLACAHAAGVVHRDLKPGNVMLVQDGPVKILDFGLAKARDETLSASSARLGTAAYMAPEQIRGEGVDARADLWALGVVLYEMLTGRKPFGGEHEVAIAHAILHDEPVRPTLLRAEVPTAMEHVTLALLQKEAARRGASAEAALHDLALTRPVAERPRPKRRQRAVLFASGLALVAAVTWLWMRQSRINWARTVALPDATRLIGQGKTYAAFRLLRQAERIVPDDPVLKELLVESTYPVTVETKPTDARVYTRDFFDEPTAWESLGTAPVTGHLPRGTLVWKISRDGFQTRVRLVFTEQSIINLSMRPVAEAPTDMVPLDGGPYEFFSTKADLDDFWIDKYEVTNRQFREFIDGHGYDERSYWTTPVVKDGVLLTRKEAQHLFRDRTGLPGPATWRLGTYPAGQDDYPVAGVSWYEAVAYCASVGKQLPTVYHWFMAATLQGMSEFAQFGNFDAEGPATVGQPLRLGYYGTYDMAGNVKEWVWNEAAAGRRYILGGGWNEPSYQFQFADAQWAWSREATHGIRCAKYRTPPRSQLARVVQPFRDYRRETPVGDDLFAVYESLYDYDRTPLAPAVDSLREQVEHWTVERVSFAAAYGDERVPAWLFLPKNARPPHQTVVYFPGIGAWVQKSSPRQAWEGAYWFLSLVRSGRAVLVPVYKGMYERHAGDFYLPNVWRDLMIQSAKDLRRALDYLETRPDIDAQRVAYLGLSFGGMVGPIMTEVEPRFKASILLAGGLYSWRRPPESDPFNFAPRVKVPTLMINGRHDFYFPVETSQAPMFRLLGTPPAHKRHHVFESGHQPSEREQVIREMLDWLDQYLGPVSR